MGRSTTTSLGASHVHCMLREGATIAELLDDGIRHRRWRRPGTGPAPRVALGHDARRGDRRDTGGTADRAGAASGPHRRPRRAGVRLRRRTECDRSFGGERADPDRRRRGLPQRWPPTTCCGHRSSSTPPNSAHASCVYLRARLALDDGPLVVADVGWGGTIQEGLTRILRSDGIDERRGRAVPGAVGSRRGTPRRWGPDALVPAEHHRRCRRLGVQPSRSHTTPTPSSGS